MTGKPPGTPVPQHPPRILEPPRARFCLAAVVNTTGELFLVRRSRDDDFAPGLWGLPGGHIHEGEDPEATILRELKEELGGGLSLHLLRRTGPVRDTLYGGVFEVHLFLFRCDGGEVRLDEEHDDFSWVPKEHYRTYAVVDGIDEDLAYLDLWPVAYLNRSKLPATSA